MFVPDEKPMRRYLFVASPVAFRSRLIFTGPDPLQRARFPYRQGLNALPVAPTEVGPLPIPVELGRGSPANDEAATRRRRAPGGEGLTPLVANRTRAAGSA